MRGDTRPKKGTKRHPTCAEQDVEGGDIGTRRRAETPGTCERHADPAHQPVLGQRGISVPFTN